MSDESRRTVSIEREGVMPDSDACTALQSVIEEFEQSEDYENLWSVDMYYRSTGWRVKLVGESFK